MTATIWSIDAEHPQPRVVEKAVSVLEHLRALHEVIDADLVDHDRHEAYALLFGKEGVCRVTGTVKEVDTIVSKSQPERYIQAMNAI